MSSWINIIFGGVSAAPNGVWKAVDNNNKFSKKFKDMDPTYGAVLTIEGEIMADLDKAFEMGQKRYLAHKERVHKAIEWYNDHVINHEGKAFVGNNVMYNGYVYKVTNHDFAGFPYFNASFRLVSVALINTQSDHQTINF